jgi:acetyltransferase-like isoleucine patch superfamily enzyme
VNGVGRDRLAAVISAAADLADGAELGDRLRDALSAALSEIAGADAPLVPALGPLAVQHAGTPDWWRGRSNLLLAAPGVTTLLSPGLGLSERTGNLAVLGAGAKLARLSFSKNDGLIVVGDRVDMASGGLAAMNGGVVMLGEGCTAGSLARVDARNGGLVLVGRDGMWGDGVNLVTDDMHAILDLQTGRRANRYGGRIVVERHVWLSDGARLVGGARVGENSVVGYAAMVRDVVPPGAVCVGAPARPVRHGVTWTRADAP